LSGYKRMTRAETLAAIAPSSIATLPPQLPMAAAFPALDARGPGYAGCYGAHGANPERPMPPLVWVVNRPKLMRL